MQRVKKYLKKYYLINNNTTNNKYYLIKINTLKVLKIQFQVNVLFVKDTQLNQSSLIHLPYLSTEMEGLTLFKPQADLTSPPFLEGRTKDWIVIFTCASYGALD